MDITKYAGHTPGPWRWEFNAESKSLRLVGGRPMYDLTVIDFARWGMSHATMRLRDVGHAGMQLMYRVHERPDWIAPESGREHHKHWHQLLTHPDALLSADAPALLAEVVRLKNEFSSAMSLLQAERRYTESLHERLTKSDLAEIQRLRVERDALLALLRRYRSETPLGHQPHMIAELVDAVLEGDK